VIENILNDPTFFLLVLMRMSGAILLNPLFGRRNVPNMVKAGMTLMLSLMLSFSASDDYAAADTLLAFILKAVSEFAIGYAIALVMNMFLSVLHIAGDQIDMQMGMGMGRAYDPGSNVTSPMTASVYYTFLILLFFATNGHITFYKLLSDSFTAIPCGSEVNFSAVAGAVLGLFSNTLVLALKFALPIIAIEFFTEMGLGIMSRAVPSINILAVGIQLKMLVGLLILGILSPIFGTFCDQLFSNMFVGIAGVLNAA